MSNVIIAYCMVITQNLMLTYVSHANKAVLNIRERERERMNASDFSKKYILYYTSLGTLELHVLSFSALVCQ